MVSECCHASGSRNSLAGLLLFGQEVMKGIQDLSRTRPLTGTSGSCRTPPGDREMMHVTNSEEVREAREITVRDDVGELGFRGGQIAAEMWTYADARRSGYTRWTDITLYSVDEEGSDLSYVIQVVGRSVVYHTPNSPCRRGVTVEVGVLSKDAARYEALEPCTQPGCAPADLDELDDADQVATEVDRFSVYRCRNAEEVIGVMHRRDSAGGKRPEGHLSGISIRLLQVAAGVDSAIAAAMNTRRL